MNVTLFRMSTGETLIADFVGVDNQTTTVKNPCVIVQNQQGVGFMPMIPYANTDTITLNSDHVIFSAEPVEDLVNEYNRIFGSGIVLAPASAIK